MHHGIGEKPGKGTYLCLNCAQKIIINDDSEALPICPKCSYTEFEKMDIEIV